MCPARHTVDEQPHLTLDLESNPGINLSVIIITWKLYLITFLVIQRGAFALGSPEGSEPDPVLPDRSPLLLLLLRVVEGQRVGSCRGLDVLAAHLETRVIDGQRHDEPRDGHRFLRQL